MNEYEITYENKNGVQEELNFNGENILGAMGNFLEDTEISIENIIAINLVY